ncbi:DUF4202 domain-containing protein [Thalassotalea sp. LPB0316]|uniref:DUF4202 domain-containing protein n=1 Tax=Thalassotalea sp. LPB0316 TaxID=2769490 RepID=UPI001867EDDA|nr:DUF4202 domain-containing protein [Thalassotalea sp. LPB0316]QOL25745.1 DUF4202 domain-containing protein [Thalassotalea sp. LPB0316]
MSTKLQAVLAKIDEINAQDPNSEVVDGQSVAKELIYGRRMTKCLNQYWPQASDLLQIAVRAQHVKRWHIARSEYPLGKAGYYAWRKALGVFHAETAMEVMREHGYSESEAEQTGVMLRKEQLKTNSDTQTLEDVACLVFLSYYFDAFASKHDDEKIIKIVQKTWKKMSQQAKDIALSLTLPEHLGKLVAQALA